ncbi:MAG TPA: lipoyl synthase [Candidatus Brocadiia bacterium]|nr:lipoyl synthase [Candidatus Brocadiia bacterium]
MNPTPQRQRFPPWLRKRLPAAGETRQVRELLAGLNLNTVCQSAQCPNAGECFACGTATFMILGDSCTRNCRFCAVDHNGPQPVDEDEPRRVAEAAARLRLKYVVVTSVTRDDLPDGGASHFRRVVQAIRQRLPAEIEILTPDFQGNEAAIDDAALALPTVYNHNVETVPRLYPIVRPQADFRRSLAVLTRVKHIAPSVVTKSGLMVGLGEKREEVLDTLQELRQINCDMLTIGQYLRPSPQHLPVERFVTPEEFDEYERRAKEMGFKVVAAGPFVRSSYHAGMLFRVTASHGHASEGNGQ